MRLCICDCGNCDANDHKHCEHNCGGWNEEIDEWIERKNKDNSND